MRDGHDGDDPPDPPGGRAADGAFHETLSEQSVYLRYFHLMKLSQRVAHERLTRICFIDYDREMALVAEKPHAPRPGNERSSA